MLSRLRAFIRQVTTDQLYRGSLVLLVNTGLLSLFGFLFWSLAAHSYPAATVGVYSGITSGVNLLAAIAALGLPNMITRHLGNFENARELVMITVAAITLVGGILCLATILFLSPHFPASLHLEQHGRMAVLVSALVVVTAASSAIDAGLVVERASQAVLWTNLVGSIVRIVGLYAFQHMHSSGLLVAYGLGLISATGLGGAALVRRVGNKEKLGRAVSLLKSHISATGSNYLASMFGILPSTVVPLEVFTISGAVETARFAIAFLIAGFLNFIPSATSQVLFAEASRHGVPMGEQLRKAIRAVYGLLLPAMAVLLVVAPFILRVFGGAYAAEGTVCLRILTLSALFTGGTYIIDVMLIARDRIRSYVFINGFNAAAVLGSVYLMLPHGLVGAAWGWALGQGISLMLGLTLIAFGSVGRHRRAPGSRSSSTAPDRLSAKSADDARGGTVDPGTVGAGVTPGLAADGVPVQGSKAQAIRYRLDGDQLAELDRLLDAGPTAVGWEDQRWTLARVRYLMAVRFRVQYTVPETWHLLHQRGWSCQLGGRPVERDDGAVEVWPQVKEPRWSPAPGASPRARPARR